MINLMLLTLKLLILFFEGIGCLISFAWWINYKFTSRKTVEKTLRKILWIFLFDFNFLSIVTPIVRFYNFVQKTIFDRFVT